jgi:cation:H+ antiporter
MNCPAKVCAPWQLTWKAWNDRHRHHNDNDNDNDNHNDNARQMELLNFQNYPLWVNLVIFALAAGVVWLAGTRVTDYADFIATRTGIGRAAIGLVLLGGITSLPEAAVSVFSAIANTPSLAVNNMLGGVAMQKAILAAVDGLVGKEALTVVAASQMVLLQGVLTILLLVLVAVAITVGDVAVLQIGAGAWAILAAYGFSIWMVSRSQGRPTWTPQDASQNATVEKANRPDADTSQTDRKDRPLKPVIIKTVVAAVVILAAGFLLSRTAESIAAQTGLGLSFVGAVLLAISTSLPELSTVIAAMRMRQYEMAISDILGTNLFNVALIFLIDAVYRGGPVLNEVGNFSLFAALLSILLSVFYLLGLIERRNRTVARMGIDSLAILIVYLGGLFLLYQLR